MWLHDRVRVRVSVVLWFWWRDEVADLSRSGDGEEADTTVVLCVDEVQTPLQHDMSSWCGTGRGMVRHQGAELARAWCIVKVHTRLGHGSLLRFRPDRGVVCRRGADPARWWVSLTRHPWRWLGFGEGEKPRGVGEVERRERGHWGVILDGVSGWVGGCFRNFASRVVHS